MPPVVRVGTASAAAPVPAGGAPAKAPFTNNMGEAQEQARRGKLMVIIFNALPQGKEWREELLSDPDLIAAVGNAWVIVEQDLQKGAALGKKYKIPERTFPHIVLARPDGEQILQVNGQTTGRTLSKEMNAAIGKLEKAFIDTLEGALNSKTAATVAGAAGKLGNLKSDKATKVLLDLLESDTRPAVRKAAAEALGRQGKGVEALVPLLGNTDVPLRTAAVKALQNCGPAAADPAIDKLADSDPETRASAHAVASALTKFPKAKTAPWWKTAADADRAALQGEWKAWWAERRPNLPAAKKAAPDDE